MIINAYSTIRKEVEFDFPHESVSTSTRNDAAFGRHIADLMGHACDQGKREMTATLYWVIRHLERTRHRYTVKFKDLQVPPMSTGFGSTLGERISDWAKKSNSIIVFPDHSIRDPNGRLLVDRETGAADELAIVPFPKEALARRRRTHEWLRGLGIHASEDLPPVVGSDEVVMRADDEVAWRILALFVVAVRAESLASKQPIAIDRLRAKSPLAFEAMSPNEKNFIDDEHPNDQSVANFVWRYESLYTLQWALGLHDELKFANEICDVPRVAETMVDFDDREMINSARLRPATEILDATDRNLRLLWAARLAHMENRQSPSGIDGGILSERQHALNWVVQFGDANWDQVDTPT